MKVKFSHINWDLEGIEDLDLDLPKEYIIREAEDFDDATDQLEDEIGVLFWSAKIKEIK